MRGAQRPEEDPGNQTRPGTNDRAVGVDLMKNQADRT
jgi:hypothetical protein